MSEPNGTALLVGGESKQDEATKDISADKTAPTPPPKAFQSLPYTSGPIPYSFSEDTTEKSIEKEHKSEEPNVDINQHNDKHPTTLTPRLQAFVSTSNNKNGVDSSYSSPRVNPFVSTVSDASGVDSSHDEPISTVLKPSFKPGHEVNDESILAQDPSLQSHPTSELSDKEIVPSPGTTSTEDMTSENETASLINLNETSFMTDSMNDDNSSYTSNTQSLQPRSLSDGSDAYSPKMDLDFTLSSGSCSPSVLSSQGSSGKEDKEKDRKRMEHLGLLLDQHRHVQKRKRNANVKSGKQIEHKGSNTNKGKDNSGKEPPKKYNESPSLDHQVSDIPSDAINQLAKSNVGPTSNESLRSPSKKNNNPKGLFESFEKTWSTSVSSSTEAKYLEREKFCFASLVSVLLGNGGSTSDTMWNTDSSEDLSDKVGTMVPIDVIKLFLKEVIFQLDDESLKLSKEETIDGVIENILERLFKELCFLVLSASSNGLFFSVENGITLPCSMVCVSHKIYVEYATFLLNHKGITSLEIESWHQDFENVLERALLSQSEQGISGVKSYAAITLPWYILSSFCATKAKERLPLSTERKNHLASKFYSLLSNQQFLSSRMYSLGFIANETSHHDDADECFPTFAKIDILKATGLHIKDLERFICHVPASMKELKMETSGEALDITAAVVSMYNAWREACSSLAKQIRGDTYGNTCKTYNEKDVSTKKNEEVMQSVEEIHNGTVNNLSSQRSRSKFGGHGYRRSSQFASFISHSAASLTGLPTQFLLPPGEYTIDVDGIKPLLVEKRSTRDNTRQKTGQNRRDTDVFQRKGKLRVNISSPVMRLSDVLNIDITLIHTDLKVGKSLYLLAQSISKAFNDITCLKDNACINKLSGPVATVAALRFTAASLDTYAQTMNGISFLLSDDLDNVDEDDLVDLGYFYDGNSEGTDPSSRMKQLRSDRNQAQKLLSVSFALMSESWYLLGHSLACGGKQGYSGTIEMSGISVLNRLNQGVLSPGHRSNTGKFDNKKHSKETERALHPSSLGMSAKVLLCFQLALKLLIDHMSEDGSRLNRFENIVNGTIYDDEQDIIVYESTLRATVFHSMGLHYFEQEENFSKAALCLNQALRRRRLLLRQLQNDDDGGSVSGSSVGTTRSRRSTKRRGSLDTLGSRRSHKRRGSLDTSGSRRSRKRGGSINTSGSSRRGRQSQRSKNDSCAINGRSIFFLLLCTNKPRNEQIESLEIDLSQTLEFSALASHSLFEYETSLSLFQESLILRALHLGKNSLDAASLQYNMGVVHDDLAQHEASLGRYGESLRVRLKHLEKISTSMEWDDNFFPHDSELDNLEASIVLTLRCIGNVHRALHAPTSALDCYFKAIDLLKSKLSRLIKMRSESYEVSTHSDIGFGSGIRGKAQTLPMPNIILDEMRISTDSFSLNNTMCSSHVLSKVQARKNQLEGLSEEDKIRNDIANLYTTIVVLVKERKEQSDSNSVRSELTGYSSVSFNTSSSYYFPSGVKTKSAVASCSNDQISINASMNLGMNSLYFGEYKNAIFYFEETLRTLWTSGGSSGESSDSDLSSKLSSAPSTIRTRPSSRKSARKDQTNEGALYHALGLSHAALDDHERAIRCFVTSLRYYRKQLGTGSIVVAGVLYDTALSYWHIYDYNRSEDFWADCLRILLSKDISEGSIDNDKIASRCSYDLKVANTLFNIAASKICKSEYEDRYIVTCLDDALNIFKNLGNKTEHSEEIAHCHFYIGYVYFHLVSTLDPEPKNNLKKNTRKSLDSCINVSGNTDISVIDRNELVTRSDYLRYSLGCIDESLSLYLSSPEQSIESKVKDSNNNDTKLVGQKTKHPMQAHIAHITGLIYDAIGSITQALWNYNTAIRLLNSIYTPKNMFTASVLHSLGDLFLVTNNKSSAMQCFQDSLDIRNHLLGSSHPAIANSLVKLAGLHEGQSGYLTSISMYAQCLKIRMAFEGNDGTGVVITLLEMGILHSKYGYNKKAFECLIGALKVRKDRVQAAKSHCSTLLELKGIDAAEIDEKESSQGTGKNTNQVLFDEEVEMARVLFHLGNVQMKLGDIDKSFKFYDESLLLRRKLCGFGDGCYSIYIQEHGDKVSLLNHDILKEMANTLHNIGWVWEMKNMQQQALSCYYEALVIKRSLCPSIDVTYNEESEKDDYVRSANDLSSAITLIRIGSIHVKLHNYEISLSYYKSALRIQRRLLGHDHIAVAQTLSDMGQILRQRAHYPLLDGSAPDTASINKAAMKCFNEALRISKQTYGQNHETVAGVMFDIGAMYDQGGEFNDAIHFFHHSTMVYGRVYSRTICKSFFGVSLYAPIEHEAIEDSGNDGLSNLGDIFTRVRQRGRGFQSPFSIENARAHTHFDSDRERYLRASLALAKVVGRATVKNGSSIQSIEILLFKILDIIASGVSPLKSNWKNNLNSLAKILTMASQHATVTSETSSSAQYLHLIQE